MPSFKLVLISTSVLSAAIMLRFSVPVVAVNVPSIYNGVVSWLRPPYLYLVINCIIITIVASSKLQSKRDDASPSPAAQPLDAIGIVHPQAAPVAVKSIDQAEYPAAEYKYNGVVLDDYEEKVGKVLEMDACDAMRSANNEPFVVDAAADGGVAFPEDATSNKENECVIAKCTWSGYGSKSLRVNSPSTVRPPASARFGHRRSLKASPEGGKTVLGVSKPRKQDTLESTWKTITEGRAIPITRHLRKSDTWERDTHVHGSNRHQQQLEKTPPQKTMTKAETFNDRTNTRTPSPASSGGSGKLRKEPSLGQDELNRRVEAFIKKFNEEMRLQRQESLNQYREMINRGSH